MITKENAMILLRTHLRDPKKIQHSLAVADLMNSLAGQFRAPKLTWHLTGLLHDIDYQLTKTDFSRHGIAAENLLKGFLPPQAIAAIRAHDYRTGIVPTTRLAHALIFADIIDNLSSKTGAASIRTSINKRDWASIRRSLPSKKAHIQQLVEFISRWPEVKV